MANTFTPEQIAQILEEFFNTVGTRQYIGARYVPIFGRKDEDSIEWDNTDTYEPLTIVLYQGNSYTSRQFVPVGVEITNQEFWALTGNYNAQVEQYRRETAAAREVADSAQQTAVSAKEAADASQQTADGAQQAAEAAQGDIDTLLPKTAFSSSNTVKQVIDNTVNAAFELEKNASYVGLYGATEDTSGLDWPSILGQIAAVSDTVYFGSGSWDVGSGLVIPNGIKKIVGNGATLYTSEASASYLVQTNTSAMSAIGINFDGRGKVSRLLESNGENWQQISSCNFYNIGSGNFGIWNAYLGLNVIGCSFNVMTRTDPRFVTEGGICIKSHTDNQIVGCKFFKFDVAVSALGMNIGNCYFWCNDDNQGICIAPEGFTTEGVFKKSTFDVCITNCEFDCIKALCVNPKNFTVTNCHFYWNDSDITSTLGVFLYNGDQANLNNIVFSNNIIKTQNISYDVYMFGTLDSTAEPTSLRLRNYTSEDNQIAEGVYNLTAIKRYHLLIGLINNDVARSGSYRNVLTPQDTLGNVDVAKADFQLKSLGIFEYTRIDSARDMLLTANALRVGTRNYITVFYNDTGHDVIPISPLAIGSIKVNNATPFWFTLYSGRDSGVDATQYPNKNNSYYANYTMCSSE